MDSGHSDQTSTFYGLSRWSSRPSTIPKDPPLYISMDQLISYVESPLSFRILPLCPVAGLCLL